MSLRCLFVVQGEGRGHLTQAMSLRRLLSRAGHDVGAVVVGQSGARSVPSFFHDAFSCPVHFVDSPSFVPDADDRSVRPLATILHEGRRVPDFWESLQSIDRAIERYDPDVLVNFFEPLVGVYASLFQPPVPIVAIAHQYMFLHRAYEFPPGRPVRRWALRAMARVASWGGARRMALSLYPAPDREADRLCVCPPLLREAVFEQPTDRSESFYLAYILNSGYADEIVRWHERNPDVRLHCFWDRSDAGRVERYDDTLTFHQLDDEKFLHLMARAQGFVSTAGFESIAEAMYLGTPVQVVPVDGHFEQLCNAFDTVRAGAGVRSSTFNLDHIRDFDAYDPGTSGFREWVHRGRSRFVTEIESVGRGQHVRETVGETTAEPNVLETV